MRRRVLPWRSVLLACTSAASVVLLPPAPAYAAAPGLAISVPASVNLGSRPAGAGTITASLGAVRVTTTAVALQDAGWVATVSTTPFTTGGGTAAETVAKSAIAYRSGTPTASSGVAALVCTPGQTVTPEALTTAVQAFRCVGTGAVGGTSLTWNPQITVTLGAASVAGTYTGTITHSVV